MFAIIISEKGGAERREAFDKNEINVGRVQGNDLMLPKGNVSKHHARLLFRDGRFIVTDLKSTNGTYVNGRKIAQATIVREGDKIYIGDFVIRLEGSEAGTAAEAEGPERRWRGPSIAERCAGPSGRRRSPWSSARAAAPPSRHRLSPSRCDASPSATTRSSATPTTARACPPQTWAPPPGAPETLRGSPWGSRPPSHEGRPLRGRAHARTGAHSAPPPPLPGPVQSHIVGPGTVPLGLQSQASQAALQKSPGHASAPPPPARPAVRETSQQAAQRLALITLVDRVAETIDLTPLKTAAPLDEAFTQLIEKTVRDQAKVMRDEGETPDGTDPELLIRDALRELVALGPIGPLLEDDDVTEIHCVRHDQVLALRAGTLTLADASFTSEDALGAPSPGSPRENGRSWRPGELVLERRIARGAQMLGIAPPASAGYVLIIRKRRRVDSSLEEFVRSGALSRAMATFVESCLGLAPTSSSAGRPRRGPRRSCRRWLEQALEATESWSCRTSTTSASSTVTSSRSTSSTPSCAARRPSTPPPHAADRLVVCSLAGSLAAATIDAIAAGPRGSSRRSRRRRSARRSPGS